MCVCRGEGAIVAVPIDDVKHFDIGNFENLFKGTMHQECKNKLKGPSAYGVKGGGSKTDFR